MRRATRLLVPALAVLLGGGCKDQAPDAQLANCPDPVAGCRFELGGETVRLRFSQPPRAMRPFVMEVEAPRAVAVAADFTMPGMDMLPNHHDLAQEPDGRWHAAVVLPLCISGRADWHLALTVGDQRASVPFSAKR